MLLRRDHYRTLVYATITLTSLLAFYQLTVDRYRQSVLLRYASHPAAELVFSATSRSNMSWVQQHLGGWKTNVYRVDDETAELRVPRNKGNEGMVILTFLIDRYDTLPEVTVFLHDNRYQWHNDNPLYDNVISIRDLNLTSVQRSGYLNLRCAWIPGCPAELTPLHYLRDAVDDPDHPTAMEYPLRFTELFPDVDLPQIVGVPCCSQFAVSRARIRTRPLADYVRWRQWLENTTLPDETSGRVLEYAWHIMFGKPAQHCMNPKECYCHTYGYCNLTDEEVEQQYIWRGLELPADWPRRDE